MGLLANRELLAQTYTLFGGVTEPTGSAHSYPFNLRLNERLNTIDANHSARLGLLNYSN